MRYLPRPSGQRSLTWPTVETYSLTRPLILETESSTLTSLSEKRLVSLPPPMPSPVEAVTLTSERPATVLRRSPMDERLRPPWQGSPRSYQRRWQSRP